MSHDRLPKPYRLKGLLLRGTREKYAVPYRGVEIEVNGLFLHLFICAWRNVQKNVYHLCYTLCVIKTRGR